MAALAYSLLPVSGLLAYFKGSTARVRFHGLQAILFGAVWPVLLYAATWTRPVVTQLVFVGGLLTWLTLLVSAAIGRDWELPVAGRRLRLAAEPPPPAAREAVR